MDLVFGDDGLKPGLVKMFLDPHHQREPGAEFDHESTTRWMRYFVREGLKRTRARGDDLAIITTLYGPPVWATKRELLRGRDLDPARRYDLARYTIDWVRYLRQAEKLPIKYVSLHNEGEDWLRWPADVTPKPQFLNQARQIGFASHVLLAVTPALGVLGTRVGRGRYGQIGFVSHD